MNPSSTICRFGVAAGGGWRLPLGWPLLLLVLTAGCGDRGQYPRRPITLVCPWAAGGGTDRVSRQLAVHLERELGKPVNVINATGGKGVTGHRRGLQARPDGYTLTMATVELNMLHWNGLTQLDWQDCVPLMSINEDYAALLVREDAPWQDVGQLEQAIQAEPGKLRASGTASGGIWHLALAGWLQHQGLKATDVVWISSQGAGPSLQELLSGGLDMVCCSLPEASSLYKAGKVRALGVMAPQRVAGFDEVPTFAEQASQWSMGGWRGLALPLGTPPERVEVLRRALRRVVTGQTQVVQALEKGQREPQTFPGFLRAQGFDSTWRDQDEFREFLAEQDAKFEQLLTSESMRSVLRDPFPSWAFPALIGGVLTAALLSLAGQRIRRGDTPAQADVLPWPPPRRGVINFAAIVGSMLIYMALAEDIGFLLTGGAVLLALLCLFGTRWWQALLITLIVTPLVYQLFANVLRVPLPRGLLGW